MWNSMLFFPYHTNSEKVCLYNTSISLWLGHEEICILIWSSCDTTTQIKKVVLSFLSAYLILTHLSISVEMSTQVPNISPAIQDDVYYAKGEFLDSGASGILEILPCGNIVKSPWPGQFEKHSRRDLTIEYEIYSKVGRHPRLVKIIDWNPQDCVLTMEYMRNGNLQTFLARNDTVAEAQRLRWAQDAAEGVQLLHDANILHCDINPKNFLLDAQLGLKIADFGGSSLAGSKPSAYSGLLFSLPDRCWRDPPTVQDDLFALGTTIYFIMTCQLPFPGLSDGGIEENYWNHKFPDVSRIVCGQSIKRCWIADCFCLRN